MTRDVLVLGPDGLILKPLLPYIIEESLYTAILREIPLPYHILRGMIKKKNSVSQKLRHFRIFLKKVYRARWFLLNLIQGDSGGLSTAFSLLITRILTH